DPADAGLRCAAAGGGVADHAQPGHLEDGRRGSLDEVHEQCPFREGSSLRYTRSTSDDQPWLNKFPPSPNRSTWASCWASPTRGSSIGSETSSSGKASTISEAPTVTSSAPWPTSSPASASWPGASGSPIRGWRR